MRKEDVLHRIDFRTIGEFKRKSIKIKTGNGRWVLGRTRLRKGISKPYTHTRRPLGKKEVLGERNPTTGKEKRRRNR